MAIREGRWDCPSCGSTGIYGRHVECMGCGKPRPAGIRFYLSDDAPVVTDAARLREARAGADWVCEHCGASSRATEDDCGGCGAARGTSPSQRVIDYDNDDVPRSGGASASGTGARTLADAGGPGEPGKKKRGGGCLGCGLLFLVLPVVMSAIASLADPPVGGEELKPAVVESRQWERTVLVEQRRVVDGEGWELPDSAQVVRQRRRVHHNDEEVIGYRSVTREVPRTERVRDGTETRTREVKERVHTGTREYVCGQRDLGNGYFEDIECEEDVYETRTHTESYEVPRYRDVTTYETVTEDVPITRPKPVYQTYYSWRVPQWSVVDTLRAEGDTTRPVWPDTTIRRNRRLGPKTERYTLVLREPGGARRTLDLGMLQWSGWRPGERVALRTGDDGAQVRILPADSLAACRRWHRDRKKPPADSLGCSPPPPEPASK
ncbi:MAG TPA: hypothetical protein VGC13_18045 [Longimicrobium sp.]|jgi:hypothetical protein|uniref:hypothetical protein n=1 Tax=Longimicrobium sp. TaxID=2029185 RepID=UPI002ED8C489